MIPEKSVPIVYGVAINTNSEQLLCFLPIMRNGDLLCRCDQNLLTILISQLFIR
jgi:hypothetical protein